MEFRSASLLFEQEETEMEDMGKNRQTYEIRIKQGREYRATIDPERVNSNEEFFSSAYQDAKVQLREILLAFDQNSKRDTKGLSTKKSIEQLREYPNNVIAFCADRGRGKTTAMLSFSSALDALSAPQKDTSTATSFWKDVSPIEDGLQNIKFEVLSPIDPTAMENSESVLQQIISQMFENFCRKIPDRFQANADNRDFGDLSDKFQKCAQAIDSLYKDPKTRTTLIEDELDQIAEIGQSAKLLLLLHELVDRYLDFMCGGDGKCCLVVQIDDSDMDIGRAYQILEDMRKYLGLPRVIVLMATNIQQLETTVEQHFLLEYKHGLKYSRSMITVERCHDIAVLYLEKAIPHTRRIYLPDIDKIIRQHLSHIRVFYEDTAGKNILTSDGTYQKQLLDLLYQKTGMVFTFEEDYLHNLLPKHMRELSQFLPFFANMKDLSDGYELAAETFIQQGFPDPDKAPKHLDQWEKNLERLEFYLVNLWSAINLRENSRNLFLEFVTQPEPIRNLFLLRKIADYYVQERTALESSNPELVWDESDCRNEFTRACEFQGINLISYSGNTQAERSVSYADVMGVMTVLTNLPGGDRQYKFAYAIRLFYSIRLHLMLIQEIRALGVGIPSNDSDKEIQPINFRTLTDILQDTLLKCGPINDTSQTPFGCWILEMPVQWFQSPLLPKEHTLYGTENPFLRWKHRDGNTVHTISTIGPEGVSDKVPGRVSGVWRPTATVKPPEQGELGIVVFSPLYPLFASLDRLIRLQNTLMISNDAATKNIHMSQIYIALLVCLNWDVQRVLFKKIKVQTSDTAVKMVEELYNMYIAELLTLMPKEAPSWLNSKCYEQTWKVTNRVVFDVLTMRVHPAPEFKTYLRNANKGLTEFEQPFSQLKEWEQNALSASMSSLWEKASNDPANDLGKTLGSMDEVVSKILAFAVAKRCSEEVSKNTGDSLHTLLADYLEENTHREHPQFSSQKSSLTPTAIRDALVEYKKLLEHLLRCKADTPDGKSVELQAEPQREDAPPEKLSPDTLSQANDREEAVKTLQALLLLGQQILSVLTPPQQASPSEPKQ